jgi:hypothetical protein
MIFSKATSKRPFYDDADWQTGLYDYHGARSS